MRDRTIGPRMRQLCYILATRFGGSAPSQSAVYMMLDYNGGSSNSYGHRAMMRAQRAGLIRPHYQGPGLPVPVTITDAGRAAITR